MAASRVVPRNVNATLSLQAGGLDSVDATAALSNSASLAATDGADDFTGLSGKDFGAQSKVGINDVLFSADSKDLSAFIGTGTVSLIPNTYEWTYEPFTSSLARPPAGHF